jgi:capsular polysaccharide biosynthesis protein
MIKKKLRAIYKKIFIKIFLYYYGSIKLSNKKIKKYKIIIKYKNKNFINNIYNIKNLRIFTDNLYNVSFIKDNSLIKNISNQQHASGYYLSPRSNKVLTTGTPKIKRKFKGKVLSLIQGASGNNYYHWLYDILPKLYLAHINKKMFFNYYYFPEIKNPYQKETLKFLKIDENKIIDSGQFKHIQVEDLYIAEHPYYKKGSWSKKFNYLPEWIIYFLRKNFLKHKKKFKCNKKIFIDRSDTNNQHNQITNNNYLISFLKKEGFKSYRLSELSFSQQIYLFYNAKIIIGPHGAGFANICFCKKNTKIIDLKSQHFKKINLYKRISKINKIKYLEIINHSNKQKKMTVNIKMIKKILKYI